MVECHMCGKTWMIEHHHVFAGPYRKKSTQYGYVWPLCAWCHRHPIIGVHYNQERNLMLKREAQEDFEKTHSREEFRRIFGKSYILEDEE